MHSEREALNKTLFFVLTAESNVGKHPANGNLHDAGSSVSFRESSKVNFVHIEIRNDYPNFAVSTFVGNFFNVLEKRLLKRNF